MGNTISFIESEKLTWIDHVIVFDENVRQANLKTLENAFPVGSSLLLAFQDREFKGLKYQHWFVADGNGQYFLEFGTPSDPYNARVQINTYPHSPYQIETECKVDEGTRDRMEQVLGTCNYSLLLRNCEHVANFVFRERWISFQTEEQGPILRAFENYLIQENKKKINIFPSTIRPKSFHNGIGKQLYTFMERHYTATQFNYFLDHNEDTYNIVVLGPTGAGKSHLINLFFNQPVCDSSVSHKSVTKEMCFIKGRGSVYNMKNKRYEEKKIVVADTVGLCDTEWDDAKIVNLIKGRVSGNFRYIDAVFVVFKADRLLKEHVKNIRIIMEWLGYYKNGNNYLKFLFVGSHAENILPADKERLRSEAIEILGLRSTTRDAPSAASDDEGDGKVNKYESLVYTGFPPEELLNDLGKQRVEQSWDLLQPLLLLSNGETLEAYSALVDTHKGGSETRIGIPNWWTTSCTIL